MSPWKTDSISDDWVRGFVEAEGSFYFYIVNETSKPQGKASFSIVQGLGQTDANAQQHLLEQINVDFFKNKGRKKNL